MRRLSTHGIFLLLLVAITGCATGSSTSETLVLALRDVTIVDATQQTARAGQTIIIRDGVISEVGPVHATPIPRNARIIDARGEYAIPGLWDMHVHLTMAGKDSLPLFVANGVTSARDMGGRGEELKTWRDEIRSGERVGPALYLSGPILESARFYEILGKVEELLGRPVGRDYRVGVATPEEAKAAVESVRAGGYDLVKIRSVASDDVLAALLAASSAAKIPLAGHPPAGSLLAAVNGGMRSLEHAFVPALEGDDRTGIIRAMHAHGTFYTPTLIAGERYRLLPEEQLQAEVAAARIAQPRLASDSLISDWDTQLATRQFEGPMDWKAIGESARADVRDMSAAGIPILAGTDLGVPLVFPGSSLHDELAFLVRAGLTPHGAITAATRNAAMFFGVEDRIGTLEQGKAADIVLLTANPLEDIRNTRSISAVVLGGQIHDRPALDALTHP